MTERDVCENCGNYREVHYLGDGSWNPDLDCSEFYGRNATEKEREAKPAALTKHYLRVAKLHAV